MQPEFGITPSATLLAISLDSQNPSTLTAHLVTHPLTQFLTQQHLPLNKKVSQNRERIAVKTEYAIS